MGRRPKPEQWVCPDCQGRKYRTSERCRVCDGKRRQVGDAALLVRAMTTSYSEIARQTGLTSSSVRARAIRAMRRAGPGTSERC